MDIFRVYLDWLDDKVSDDEMRKAFGIVDRPHGHVVDYIQEPYRDVFVYEDGYEESYSIGD